MPFHPTDMKVLFVLPNKGKEEGITLSAIAAAYFAFSESIPDVIIEFASPQGGACATSTKNIAVDPRAKAFAEDDWEGGTRLDLLTSSKKIADLGASPASSYATLFVFGDAQAVVDFTGGDSSARDLVAAFYNAGKPVGAIEGGVAAFVGVRDDRKGTAMLKDAAVACCASLSTLIEKVKGDGGRPKIIHAGGGEKEGDNAVPDVCIWEKIVTGPNAVSAQLVAQGLIEMSKDDEALETARTL